MEKNIRRNGRLVITEDQTMRRAYYKGVKVAAQKIGSEQILFLTDLPHLRSRIVEAFQS